MTNRHLHRKDYRRLPLSYPQERLWFIHRLQGSTQYNLPWLYRMEGAVDESLILCVFRDIMERHEVLRTLIREESGIGYQEIIAADQWEMQTVEAKGFSGEGLQQCIREWIERPFRLEAEPPLRVALFRTAGGKFILLIVIHHIAFDGWSMDILIREMMEFYCARVEKREALLTPLPLQYADYAIWQRQSVPEEVMADKTAYWKDKLAGLIPLGLLPDGSRVTGRSIRGKTTRRCIGKAACQWLNAVANREGVTLFTLLLTLYKIVLHRHSGQEDLCVGIAAAGREQPELHGLIGFFVNMLPIRSTIRGNMSFTETLREVKRNLLEAYQHQEVPFGRIVEAAAKERFAERNPLYQTTFVLQNRPLPGEMEFSGVRIGSDTNQDVSIKFDIQMDVIESSEDMQICLTYSADLYETSRMEAMADHYAGLMEELDKKMRFPVGRMPLLKPSEESRLTKNFNETQERYPRDRQLVELFREQAVLHPDSIALIAGEEEWTFTQVDERSDRLAGALVARGIVPGNRVGLYSLRGPEMIISMLGILKSGCAYVPMNLSFPLERLQYMARDAAVSHIVYVRGGEAIASSREMSEFGVIRFEDSADHPPVRRTGVGGPGSCAYVMFTSGTTGNPKGIAVSHRNIIKLVYDAGELAVLPEDRVLQWANYAFDGSTYEIFGALLKGAALCLIEEDITSDVTALARLMEEKCISVCFLTTSLFNAFVDIQPALLRSLRRIVFGGEAASLAHVRRALQECGPLRLINGYGPTETTVFAVANAIRSVEGYNTVPIGRPLSNTRILILDEHLQPVPVGTSGEIYIGGDGVSLGYIGANASVSDKFIRMDDQAGRWYRTGDYGRWDKDGQIEYLGRRDQQVKIRGFRIEPGEIVTYLQEAPGVKQAAVVVDDDPYEGKRLVAYIVPDGLFSRQRMLDHARQHLPDYMVPSIVIELTRMPLNSNGKLDRKRLPPVPVAPVCEVEYQAPVNVMERQLVAIWKGLLGLPEIGTRDNFFELGGHSLLLTRMTSAIRKELQLEVSVRELFAYPTIAGLAAFLMEKPFGELLPPIVTAEPMERWPLSFQQERLWFIDQLSGSANYHIPLVFRLPEGTDTEVMKFALCELVKRHEIFRSVILADEDGKPFQRAISGWEWQPQEVWGSQEEEAVEEQVRAFIAKPFDLSADFMLRALLVHQSGGGHILALVFHHIAFDGWSLSILSEEFAELLRLRQEGSDTRLREPGIQYRDYAVWQRTYLTGPLMDVYLDWWKNTLRDLAQLDLPTDHPRPAVLSPGGALQRFVLDEGTRAGLNDLSRREGATLFMTMLAALKILLSKYSGLEDIAVGTPVANRTRSEIERTIGFFVNTIVLRDKVSDELRFVDLLQVVKNNMLEAYARQDAPLEKVVGITGVPREMNRNPLFQVLFALQNTDGRHDVLPGDGKAGIGTGGYITSKFDLNVTILSSPGELSGLIEYPTDLFTDGTIREMADELAGLFRSVAADPYQSVSVLKGKEEENYWREYSNGTSGGCLLPMVRPKSREEAGDHYREEVLRPETGLVLRAEAFVRDHHITLDTLLQGVWAYLLYRYTGHDQVIFDLAGAGRPVLYRIAGELPVAVWLQEIQQWDTGRLRHASLRRIQTLTGISGELCDTQFCSGEGTADTYALSVVVGQWGGLQISFRYNDQRIDGFFVRQIAGHFGHILEQFVADGDLPCGKTELLLPEEERLLVRGINVSSVDLPSAVTLPELIDQQCRRSPDAIALVFGQRSLSYRQLQQLSDRMSRFLQNKGVGEETPVLVSVKRSLAPLVAFLAISKAGGVYVPVDPLYPDDRIAFMLGDLGCRLCLADDSLLERAGAFDPATEFIDLPALLDELQQQADDDRAAVLRCRPGGLVYIIYTSGSTGRPKGVMIEHRHLLDHVYGMIAAARLDRCARFALIASLTADAGHSILFAALLTGGAVHVLDDSLLEDGEAMARYLSQQAIDCIKIVPSLWLSYSQSGAMLLPGKVLVFGGETLGAAIAEQLVGAGYVGQVFNHYGPTEATIGKCMHAVELGRPYSTVPIGRPFSNTQLYVADTRGRLCPMGVPGELFIGGLGIARGYVGAPQLTAGRFLINRWDATAGGRVYRTGDRVRWTADGQIEYLGRMDDQLKIRGYRIEPGEIEAVLQQTPGVQQAVVTAVQDANGQATLVAYLVTAPGFDRQKTLLLAQTRLPEPMIPRMLIPIPAVPLTPIGKIDKRALSALTPGDEAEYIAPETLLDIEIAAIWQELLGVERISMTDNFFSLGGHSLLSIQLLARLRKTGHALQLRDLFAFQTLEKLSAFLGNGSAKPVTPFLEGPEHLVLLQAEGDGPPVFILPGGEGLCDGYDELAAGFRGQCPVYGIQMQGVFAGEKPLDDITEIARRNLGWMRQALPTGAYRLIGHSLGGHVAYEMIRQLEAAGEIVEWAVLLDIGDELNRRFQGPEGDKDIARAAAILEKYGVIRRPFPEWVSEVREQWLAGDMDRMMELLAPRVMTGISGDGVHSAFVLRCLRLQLTNIRLRHRPEGSVGARLVVVKAGQEDWSGYDEYLGWGAHADRVEALTIPGDHGSILRRENARFLHRYLQSIAPIHDQ